MEWISVNERLPESEEGKWSDDVIAMSEQFKVYKIAHFDGLWQRTRAFEINGCKKIMWWTPYVKPKNF